MAPTVRAEVEKLLADMRAKAETLEEIRVFNEKNRAGFKKVSVKDYCKMLSLLEQDELI
jgi:hypothetical protein